MPKHQKAAAVTVRETLSGRESLRSSAISPGRFTLTDTAAQAFPQWNAWESSWDSDVSRQWSLNTGTRSKSMRSEKRPLRLSNLCKNCTRLLQFPPLQQWSFHTNRQNLRARKRGESNNDSFDVPVLKTVKTRQPENHARNAQRRGSSPCLRTRFGEWPAGLYDSVVAIRLSSRSAGTERSTSDRLVNRTVTNSASPSSAFWKNGSASVKQLINPSHVCG